MSVFLNEMLENKLLAYAVVFPISLTKVNSLTNHLFVSFIPVYGLEALYVGDRL